MKLKNLINYLLENMDEAALRGFSLDVLKKKMPEFRDLGDEDPALVSRYMQNFIENTYKLPYMGEGSSRTVYALSTSKVLKVIGGTQVELAGAGIAQNEAEVIVSKNPSLKYIGARVYETDPDYYWSVMEIAKVYKNEEDLKKDIGLPDVLSNARSYTIASAVNDVKKLLKLAGGRGKLIRDEHVDQMLRPGGAGKDSRFHDEKDRLISLTESQMQEYRKFLLNPPIGILALVDLTSKGLGEHKLEMGDIVSDHFGKTADGRPVLIDYGFTTGVRTEHYVWGGGGRSSSDWDASEGGSPVLGWPASSKGSSSSNEYDSSSGEIPPTGAEAPRRGRRGWWEDL